MTKTNIERGPTGTISNPTPIGTTPSQSITRHGHYKAILLVIVGLFIGFVGPTFLGVSTANWHKIVLFLMTVVGALVQPYPITVVVILGMAIGLCLGIITPEQAFKGYSNDVTWMVLLSLLLGGAITETGIGRRIALSIISRIGSNAIGLVYSLAIADLILAPATPSNTARSGGIIFPLAHNLAHTCGSDPGPTARNLGSFLLFAVYQTNVITSAMFLTAMALNPLAVELARQSTGVTITWMSWFLAALVPGLISLALIPYLIYKVYPPEVHSTPNASQHAQTELVRMGSLRKKEKGLILILLLLIGVLITSTHHNISPVVAMLAAVCSLIVCGIVDLEQFLSNKVAWAAFLWVGGIISLVGVLDKAPVIELTGRIIHYSGLGHGISALVVLASIYFFLHYVFASMTAQMVLLYSGFLTAAIAVGAPPLLASLLFAFLSSLYACLTYYGSAAAAIYFSSGYIDRISWLRVGFMVGIVNLLVWFGIGIPWCKMLGIW